MKKIILIIISTILLYSCAGVRDAGKILRNEKTSTTDEFLVKKRNPLVLPPNYEKIPEPGSIQQKEKNEQDKIKKILKVSEEENLNKKTPSSVENSILNKIRK